MKKISITALSVFILSTSCFAPVALSNDRLPMNGSLETKMGVLDFESGYPSDITVKKLYDEMDYQRATQAYLWALPIVAFAEWQHSHRSIAGASNIDYVAYLSGAEKLGILTPNATTPYYLNFADLSETGPLVVEEPEGLTAGGILDMWQRPSVDTGQIGPFKGKGGRYLVLGPTHADMEVDGYTTVRVRTNSTFIAFRVLDPRPEVAKDIVNNLKIYPYEKRDNPPVTKIVPAAGKTWIAGQPVGMAYWERLADILEREPVDSRDLMMMAMLRPLGIVKGQGFKPNKRQQAILKQAALIGESMARATAYAKRQEGARVWSDRLWEMSLLLTETNQDLATHTQLDERASWFYEAVGVAEAMMCRTVNAGQCYLESQKDSEGRWLNGSKSYRLTVPANAPVKLFWSFSVYDTETRSLIATDSRKDLSSRMDLQKNSDDSVDLYFGPVAPEGKESNWIKTIPGRGWFTYFRLYGPSQEFFDRAWKLNNIERLD